MKRNLIYYIHLIDTPALWLNLELMNWYINSPVFNGQRIIKISGVIDNANRMFDKYPWLLEAESVPNHKDLHEAPHFKDSLERLETSGPSMTFYGHAKGVSRVWNKPLENWIRLMYKGNLDQIPDLGNKLFSGCFGKLRRGSDNVPVPWHYSGTFYWFNTVPVLDRYFSGSRMNPSIPPEIDNRWFTENFPGWIASQSEAEFKLYSSREKSYNLYTDKFWLKHSELCKLVN